MMSKAALPSASSATVMASLDLDDMVLDSAAASASELIQ